MYKLI